MHECRRCGYTTPYKSALKSHLLRQRPCKVREGLDASLLAPAMLLEALIQAPRTTAHEPSMYTCEHCGKLFAHRQNRYAHYRSCRAKQMDVLMEKIDSMEKQLSEFQHHQTAQTSQAPHSTTTTTHHTTNNIQINHHEQFHINAFGKEDTGHLTHQFLNGCVRKTGKGLVELLEQLHFGQQDGRNANVRISNKKLPLAETQDGRGNWMVARKDTVLNAMLDRGHGILQDHLDDHQEEIKESVSDSMYEYIMEWFEKVADKDKNSVEDILLDIYVLLLNKSKSASAIKS